MKLGKEELDYMKFFENITKTHVKDCVIDEEEVVFVVAPENMGAAIGRNGENVKKIKEKTSKKVSIVKHADNPQEFIKNLFAPARLDKIEVKDDSILVSTPERKRVIGQKGNRIKRAKTLMQRYFGIKEIVVR
jgi:N utilization substance protein A